VQLKLEVEAPSNFAYFSGIGQGVKEIVSVTGPDLKLGPAAIALEAYSALTNFMQGAHESWSLRA
jgi:hypothetical protein